MKAKTSNTLQQKRTILVAARKRMAEAQKLRWAKVRGEVQTPVVNVSVVRPSIQGVLAKLKAERTNLDIAISTLETYNNFVEGE